MKNDALDILYEQIEAKYKNASGDARIAFREVLDMICNMDGEENAGYDGEKLISVNQFMDIINSECGDVHEAIGVYATAVGFSLDALNEILSKVPAVKVVPLADYLEMENKLKNITESFTDYVTDGINNPAWHCANRCEECTNAYGFCKNDANCKGFSPSV